GASLMSTAAKPKGDGWTGAQRCPLTASSCPPAPTTSPHELTVRRRLRGLGVAKDILVRPRDRIERYRNVPASLEAEILFHGKHLYADLQRGTGAKLVGQSPARPRCGSLRLSG